MMGLLLLLALSSTPECSAYPFMPRDTSFADGIPLKEDVHVHSIGTIASGNASFCIYSYKHFWGAGRETSRILLFDSNGHLMGYYTMPYRSILIAKNHLYGVTMDGDKEIMDIVENGKAAKSVYFDGDTFPMNATK